MTKKLSVLVSNRDALLDLTNQLSGKWTHTATEVSDIAAEAEKRLDRMCMPKGNRKGVVATHTTKGPAAAAYQYAVKGSTVTLRRASDGWRVTRFIEASVFPQQGGKLRLYISPEQDVRSVEALRRANGVMVRTETVEPA